MVGLCLLGSAVASFCACNDATSRTRRPNSSSPRRCASSRDAIRSTNPSACCRHDELVEPRRQPVEPPRELAVTTGYSRLEALEPSRKRLELGCRLTPSALGSSDRLQPRPGPLLQHRHLVEPRRQPLEPTRELPVTIGKASLQTLEHTRERLELTRRLAAGNSLLRSRDRLQPRPGCSCNATTLVKPRRQPVQLTAKLTSSSSPTSSSSRADNRSNWPENSPSRPATVASSPAITPASASSSAADSRPGHQPSGQQRSPPAASRSAHAARPAHRTATTPLEPTRELAVALTDELVEPRRQPLELTRELLELSARITAGTSVLRSRDRLQPRPGLLMHMRRTDRTATDERVEPSCELPVALTDELVEPRRQPLELTRD